MYKLIVSDLDETLLSDKHRICEENITAIKMAGQLGVKFVPATGRGYMAIQNVLMDLNLIDKEREYVISLNGCAVTENKNNKVMIFNPLPFNKAEILFKYGLKTNMCIHIYTADEVYIYNLNEDEKRLFIGLKNTYIEIYEPSIEFLRNTPIAKVIYENPDIHFLMSFEDEVKSITENLVNVSYSSNRYMELNEIGADKGTAMLNLANLLNIKKEETIAVGDNYNDLSMLKAAGLSVAAGNAVEDVKKVCNYTTCNDNNEGVLKELIEKFILNEPA